MNQTLTKHNKLPLFMSDNLINFHLTDITTEIILEILEISLRDMLRFGMNPTFQAFIMNILNRSRTFA
jgi:hypothetical protein